MGALMRLQAVEPSAAKLHGALLVAQRAADAIHQRALAGPIGSDEPQTFTGRNRERNIFQCNKAAKALAQIFDFEERRCGAAVGIGGASHAHGTCPGISASTCRRPTKSSGFR